MIATPLRLRSRPRFLDPESPAFQDVELGMLNLADETTETPAMVAGRISAALEVVTRQNEL
jgi:hypothetical protein